MILDFRGTGVTATDDSANNKTVVTIPGQTPWLQDVNAGGFRLINAVNVELFKHVPDGMGPELTMRQGGTTAGEKARIGFYGDTSARAAILQSLDFASGYGGMIDIQLGLNTDINALVSVAQFRSSQVTFSPNVGIGTASPAAKLHVMSSGAGNLDHTAFFFNDNASAAVFDGILRVRAANASATNTLLNLDTPTKTLLFVKADGTIQMWLGGALRVLSVDGSGFVKAA